jgi:hypothetical protein
MSSASVRVKLFIIPNLELSRQWHAELGINLGIRLDIILLCLEADKILYKCEIGFIYVECG